MKLVITVTDEESTATSEAADTTGQALAGGAAQTVTPDNGQVHDGGPMPELLRAMAGEVEAGRLSPPGQRT